MDAINDWELDSRIFHYLPCSRVLDYHQFGNGPAALGRRKMADLNELQLHDIPTKALVVEHAGAPFKLTDIILDEVREDELLVEMMYTGICHSVSERLPSLLPGQHGFA